MTVRRLLLLLLMATLVGCQATTQLGEPAALQPTTTPTAPAVNLPIVLTEPTIAAAPTQTPTVTVMPTDEPTVQPTASVPPTAGMTVVTGRVLTADGSIAPNVPVELCSGLLFGFYTGETPCHSQPDRIALQANDNGVFWFQNVPAGTYNLAFWGDRDWVVLTDQAAELLMITVTDGETIELGDILPITE